LGNLPSRITAGVAPIPAVIAVAFTVIAGPVNGTSKDLKTETPIISKNN
jgi:hypothetical protein